jgi:hypothetical protein
VGLPSHDFWVVTKLVYTHLSQFDSSEITIAKSVPDAFAWAKPTANESFAE